MLVYKVIAGQHGLGAPKGLSPCCISKLKIEPSCLCSVVLYCHIFKCTVDWLAVEDEAGDTCAICHHGEGQTKLGSKSTPTFPHFCLTAFLSGQWDNSGDNVQIPQGLFSSPSNILAVKPSISVLLKFWSILYLGFIHSAKAPSNHQKLEFKELELPHLTASDKLP